MCVPVCVCVRAALCLCLNVCVKLSLLFLLKCVCVEECVCIRYIGVICVAAGCIDRCRSLFYRSRSKFSVCCWSFLSGIAPQRHNNSSVRTHSCYFGPLQTVRLRQIGVPSNQVRYYSDRAICGSTTRPSRHFSVSTIPALTSPLLVQLSIIITTD